MRIESEAGTDNDAATTRRRRRDGDDTTRRRRRWLAEAPASLPQSLPQPQSLQPQLHPQAPSQSLAAQAQSLQPPGPLQRFGALTIAEARHCSPHMPPRSL